MLNTSKLIDRCIFLKKKLTNAIIFEYSLILRNFHSIRKSPLMTHYDRKKLWKEIRRLYFKIKFNLEIEDLISTSILKLKQKKEEI